MDIKEQEALGDSIDSHWYYVAKAHMLARHIPDRDLKILDIGAGSGWFSRWLLRNGIAKEAVCLDPGYGQERDETVQGAPLRFRQSVESTNADVVLLMDVLEHVDDDGALLSQYVRIAPNGTRFFITVPAFQFLWSAHDEFLDHRRRYTRASLLRCVKASGLRVTSAHYYFASIFPVAAVLRLLQRKQKADRSSLKPAPGWLNTMLLGVLAVERVWMRVNRVAGLSVVCLCHK